MVVTRSRLHAVRYHQAINAYIAAKGYDAVARVAGRAVVEVSRDLSRFAVTIVLALAGFGAWSVMIGLLAAVTLQAAAVLMPARQVAAGGKARVQRAAGPGRERALPRA